MQPVRFKTDVQWRDCPSLFGRAGKHVFWASGLAVVLLLGCGGGGGSNTPPPPPPPPPQVTSVVVSPSSTTTAIGQTQTFSANVLGTGNFSTAVTWAVNDVLGGNSTVGTISATGLFTAPAVVPSGGTLTIKATSAMTPAVSGIAQDTVVSGITSISITPVNLSIPQGQTQKYQVSIQGVANQSVTWSLTPVGPSPFDPGAISAGGLYTAPKNLTTVEQVNVTATSVLDSRFSATGSALIYPPPTITQISPATADAADVITIQGTNLNWLHSVGFTGPNHVSLEAPIDGVQAVVPLLAQTGPAVITQQLPGFPTSSTTAVPFTRIPRIRIRAGNRDISAGETTTFQYSILGQPGTQTVVWSADTGTIDANGVYTALIGVSPDMAATITGCIAGTQICDSEIIGVHPFRIDPAQPVVALGGTIQLNAIQGGTTVAATWTQANGGGTLSGSGAYTASSAVPDGGSASVAATFAGGSQTASIAVTGDFPGLIRRLDDYRDVQNFGTVDTSIAVSGNRAYVVAADFPLTFLRTKWWIDVYDITDPTHPVWLDAVEAAAASDLFTHGNFLYQVIGRDDFNGTGLTPLIAVFDISGPQPLLVDRRLVPQFLPDFDHGIVFAVPNQLNPAPPGTVYEFDLRSGSVIERDMQLAVNGSPVAVLTVTGDQARLFAAFSAQGSNELQLGVFDLTSDPPALIGAIPIQCAPCGRFMASFANITGTLLLLGSEIYDISGSLPVHVASFPLNLRESNGTLVFADTFQGSSRIVDISVPAQPKLVQITGEVGWGSFRRIAWDGNLLFFAEGVGGMTIYDTSLPGGPIEQGFLPGLVAGSEASAALDQVATPTNLFVATSTSTATSNVGVVNVYDLTSVPAARVGNLQTGSRIPVALNLSGSNLFVGTVSSLDVVDVSNPSSPASVSSLPLAEVTSLARTGATLYAGTLDQHLIVFNVSQPATPVQQLSILLPGVPDKLVVVGSLLIIGDDTAGLLIYNIASPANPVLLAKASVPGAVADVAIDGTLALLASADAGLVIVDISNPSAPIVVSQTALDMPINYGDPIVHNLAASIAISDSIAYVGTVADNDTLFAFDYRQPAHPRLISLATYVFSLSGGIGDAGALLTLLASGKSLFIGGVLEPTTPVIQAEITQPRNVINLYRTTSIGSTLAPISSTTLSTNATTRTQKQRLTPAQWRQKIRRRLTN